MVTEIKGIFFKFIYLFPPLMRHQLMPQLNGLEKNNKFKTDPFYFVTMK